MAREFVFDDNVIENLGRDAGIVGITRAAAERVAGEARSSAPVDTGAYQSSIRVEQLPGRDRTRYGVVAGDEKSLLIEARTGNLGRATGRARR